MLSLHHCPSKRWWLPFQSQYIPREGLLAFTQKSDDSSHDRYS